MSEAPRPPRRRSLWPREHGAYAQLAAPIASVLLAYAPTPAAVLLSIAACAAFLSNEPLLVLLGHRGKALRSVEGGRAKLRLAVLGTVALVGAVAGLWLAPRATFGAAGVVLIPAVVLVVFAWRRRQRSLSGELVAALVLPGACTPIAVASGVPLTTAVLLGAAWSIGFAATVVGVHRVISRHRRTATLTDRVIAVALGGVMILVGALGFGEPSLWIAAPLVAVSLVLVARPPPVRRLRAIGVALVIASVASVGVTVIQSVVLARGDFACRSGSARSQSSGEIAAPERSPTLPS